MGLRSPAYNLAAKLMGIGPAQNAPIPKEKLQWDAHDFNLHHKQLLKTYKDALDAQMIAMKLLEKTRATVSDAYSALSSYEFEIATVFEKNGISTEGLITLDVATSEQDRS